MKLYEYYVKKGFNPCYFRLKTAAEFERHFAKRTNLLVNKLKLPHMMWRGKRVLEVGPGSGENALVLAKLGAKLTFVEPIADSISGLKELFVYWKVQPAIESIHRLPMEEYETERKFDAVIGEGFIHTLSDKRAAMRKLFGLVGRGGILMISTADPVGIFLEFCKRYIVLYSCHIEGITDTPSQIEHVRIFLGEDYAKIPSSRSFEAWAQDNMLNPVSNLDSFYSFEEMMRDMQGLDTVYYSSWPSYAPYNDLTWHKNIPTKEALNQQALDGYRLRLLSFILGQANDDDLGEDSLHAAEKPFLNELSKTMVAMQRSIDDRFSNIEDIRGRFLELRRLLEHKILQAVLNEMLKLIKEPEPDVYRGCGHLRAHWGCPGHHIVFRRPMEHEFVRGKKHDH